MISRTFSSITAFGLIFLIVGCSTANSRRTRDPASTKAISLEFNPADEEIHPDLQVKATVSDRVLSDAKAALEKVANSGTGLPTSVVRVPDYKLAHYAFELEVTVALREYIRAMGEIYSGVSVHLSRIKALRDQADASGGMWRDAYEKFLRDTIPVLNKEINGKYAAAVRRLYFLGGDNLAFALYRDVAGKCGEKKATRYYGDSFKFRKCSVGYRDWHDRVRAQPAYDEFAGGSGDGKKAEKASAEWSRQVAFDTKKYVNIGASSYGLCLTSICLASIAAEHRAWHDYVEATLDSTLDLESFDLGRDWRKATPAPAVLGGALNRLAIDMIGIGLEKNKEYTIDRAFAELFADAGRTVGGVGVSLAAIPVTAIGKLVHFITSYKFLNLELRMTSPEKRAATPEYFKDLRYYVEEHNNGLTAVLFDDAAVTTVAQSEKLRTLLTAAFAGKWFSREELVEVVSTADAQYYETVLKPLLSPKP